jgi:hypothetical protein
MHIALISRGESVRMPGRVCGCMRVHRALARNTPGPLSRLSSSHFEHSAPWIRTGKKKSNEQVRVGRDSSVTETGGTGCPKGGGGGGPRGRKGPVRPQ